MHFPPGPERHELSCPPAQKTPRIAQEGLCAGISTYIQHIDGVMPRGLRGSCWLGVEVDSLLFRWALLDDPPRTISA